MSAIKTKAPIIINLRYLAKFGILAFFILSMFFACLASSLVFGSGFSGSGSASITSSFLATTGAGFFATVTGTFSAFSSGPTSASSSSGCASDSIVSLSAASSPNSSASSIFGNCGLLERLFATGIATPDARRNNASSFVIKTTVFSLWRAALAINLKFTALRNTPAFFGGTSATILHFAALIFAMISVISCSGSI